MGHRLRELFFWTISVGITDRDADLSGDGGALSARHELRHQPHGGAAPLPRPHVALLTGLRRVHLRATDKVTLQ